MQQAASGLSFVLGIDNRLVTQVSLIAGITLVATVSVVSGIQKGGNSITKDKDVRLVNQPFVIPSTFFSITYLYFTLSVVSLFILLVLELGIASVEALVETKSLNLEV